MELHNGWPIAQECLQNLSRIKFKFTSTLLAYFQIGKKRFNKVIRFSNIEMQFSTKVFTNNFKTIYNYNATRIYYFTNNITLTHIRNKIFTPPALSQTNNYSLYTPSGIALKAMCPMN